MSATPPVLAVIGAGPVGLALALQAARALPDAHIAVFDARPLARDVSTDPRVLALSLGSVQLLRRLGAFDAASAEPITEVHVSQQTPSVLAALAARGGEATVRIRAADEGVEMLGAVLRYGAIVAPLQAAWLDAVRREPARLSARFGTPVTALKPLGDSAGEAGGVEVDAGIAERFDLAIVAEGGLFGEQVRQPLASGDARRPLSRDYGQTAWVGEVSFDAAQRPPRGMAFERFTERGPAALLPLRDGAAALVWCVDSHDDPVAELDDAQRVALLNRSFAALAGRIVATSALKPFALGLNAAPTLRDGATVRIGNAAQTLHPVAGQGLNLGLRDAFELVGALQRLPADGPRDSAALQHALARLLTRLEWRRGPDRWSTILATDFLARSFTWRLPGAASARALGLTLLDAIGPAKSALARQMMFGSR